MSSWGAVDSRVTEPAARHTETQNVAVMILTIELLLISLAVGQGALPAIIGVTGGLGGGIHG